jgi:hypothetical protein
MVALGFFRVTVDPSHLQADYRFMTNRDRANSPPAVCDHPRGLDVPASREDRSTFRSMVSTVSPLVTVGLAVTILGEAFTPTNAAGTALVLAGVGFYAWGEVRGRRAP